MAMKLVPYEQQREERIKRNTNIMIQLGVLTAAQALNEAVSKSKGSRPVDNSARLRTVTPIERESCSKPQRRSSRLKGEAPAMLPIADTPDHRHALLTADAPYISRIPRKGCSSRTR